MNYKKIISNSMLPIHLLKSFVQIKCLKLIFIIMYFRFLKLPSKNHIINLRSRILIAFISVADQMIIRFFFNFLNWYVILSRSIAAIQRGTLFSAFNFTN